jgi:hypothetical protein
MADIILSHVWVMTDGFWIDNLIYLTARDYTSQITNTESVMLLGSGFQRCSFLDSRVQRLLPSLAGIFQLQLPNWTNWLPTDDLQLELSIIDWFPSWTNSYSQSQNQSQSYFMTDGLPSISQSWRQAPWVPRPEFLFSNWTLAVIALMLNPFSLEDGCRLQLLLLLASAVILRSDSRGTHDHILLSQIRDSPNLEDQVPLFISPGTGWPTYTLRYWIPFWWTYSNPPPRGLLTHNAQSVPYAASARMHRKHYFQQFLHCYVRTLLSDGWGIAACLRSCNLAMAISLAPNLSCQASCHNI